MAFKIGDRVVCIDDSAGYNDGFEFLVKDKQYTIQKTNSTAFPTLPQNVMVNGDNCYWHCTRFRKVEPIQKKSNSVTKALVEKFKESERELIEYVPEEIASPVTKAVN